MVRITCCQCSRQFPVAPPLGAPPGSRVGAGCPHCGAQNELRIPAGAPSSGPRPDGHAHHSAPAPAGGFRPPKPSGGRQKALLIGINYFGTRAQLRGCINDVHNMQKLLNGFGWRNDCCRTLTDDNRMAMPTKSNILAGLHWLVEGVRPGDVLFLHFSGHGSQKEDPHGYEEDGMNETILPVDFQSAGQLTDDDIAGIVVHSLPAGVRLTAVMDCCHSGTGLDLPFTYTRHGWKEETNPFFSAGDVQMFSGCEDDDVSADASSRLGQPGGAMTTAFCDVMRQSSAPTYAEFLEMLWRVMQARGFKQRPMLTSSQRFAVDRPFLINDIMPNANPSIGRIVRRRFPPRPRPVSPELNGLLGLGVGLLAAALFS